MSKISPVQIFEDNMRPAKLLLRVYRLLSSNDQINNNGDILDKLREILKSSTSEELLLINHELFLGLIRERADVKRSDMLERSLAHLLRQAIVTSCTALETFLPALLKANMPIVLKARGRNFLPQGDDTIKSYFKELHFSLEDTIRLISDSSAPEYISNKILGYIDHNYLASKNGVHLTGALLGIVKPWDEISTHLGREKKDITKQFSDAFDRRHDIVHRADRSKDNLSGDPQLITLVQARQMVDTVDHVGFALSELVTKHIAEFVIEEDATFDQENSQ